MTHLSRKIRARNTKAPPASRRTGPWASAKVVVGPPKPEGGVSGPLAFVGARNLSREGVEIGVHRAQRVVGLAIKKTGRRGQADPRHPEAPISPRDPATTPTRFRESFLTPLAER